MAQTFRLETLALGCAFLWCSFTAACFVDVAPPDGLRVQCATQDDCPDGYQCKAELGQCVPIGIDIAPPLVESLVVGEAGPSGECVESVCPRSSFRTGQSVVVTFDVSQRLAREPVVSAAFDGAEQRSLAIIASPDDWAMGSYRFEYTIDAADPNAYAGIAIEVIDPHGQPGGASRPLAFRADSLPPVALSVDIAYRPDRSNPRSEVSSMIAGTLASVVVHTSEPLVTPTLLATGPSTLTLDLVSTDGLSYTFEHLYSAAEELACTLDNCLYDLSLSAADAAGNPVESITETLRADGVVPEEVDVSSASVRYHRAPFGTLDAPGIPRFWVEIPGTQLQADDLLAFFTDIDPSRRLEIGVAQVRDDGTTTEFELAPQDQPYVAVVRYDAAGRASNPVWLKHQRWYASFAGKADPNNGNDVLISEGRAESPAPQISRGLSDADYLALSEPASTGINAISSIAWRQLLAGDSPPFQTWAAGEFDARNGVGLIFGGLAKTALSSQLWRLRDDRWDLVQPASAGPSGRALHTLTYDRLRQRIILVGGLDIVAEEMFEDVWEWDGQRWFEATPTLRPPPVIQGQLTYDPIRQLSVLSGGCTMDLGTMSSDCGTERMPVWAWNGTFWTEIAPSAGEHPGLRASHAAFFDPTLQGVVLTGGCAEAAITGCTAPVTDTWLLTAGGWSKIADESSPAHPTARIGAVATTDWDLGRGVVYGGIGPDGSTDCDLDGIAPDCDDIWIFEGGAWRSPAQPDIRPDGPRYPGFFYDESQRRVVLVDGVLGESGRGTRRTWAWTEAQGWQPLTGAGFKPAGRVSAAAALDRSSGMVVMFGGQCTGNYCSAYDTHTWIGGAWLTTDLGSSNPPESPGRRRRHRMASAPGGGVVLLGGENGEVDPSEVYADLWHWNGSIWSEQCGPNTAACPFSVRHSHGLAYDSGRDRLVLFGGKGDFGDASDYAKLGDHWEWDGSTWSQPCQFEPTCTEPSARFGQAMVYDEANGEILMIGGIDSNGVSSRDAVDDVWAYDGTTWQKRCGAGTGCAGPAGRVYVSAAYDAARARTVIFAGGTVGNGGPNDLWQWDGSKWTFLRAIGQQPAARVEHTMVRTADGLIMFGGDSDTSQNVAEEIWRLDTRPELRPSAVLRFQLAATRLFNASADLRTITLSAVAGGTGYGTDLDASDGSLSGAPSDGVSVLRWQNGQWIPQATTDAAADAAASIVATVEQSSSIGDTIYDDAVVLMLEPTAGAGNGPAPATLQLDHAGAMLDFEVTSP